MNAEKYAQARREGLREVHALESRGEQPYLNALSDIIPEMNRLSQVPLGILQIDLDQIDGTVTTGRMTAFSRSFHPLLDGGTEFAGKWDSLYESVESDGLRDPIKVMEYYNRYYVLEGNKRVSVMRCLDAVNIEADVTRILPEYEDSRRYRVYQTYLRFFADTRITSICFSTEEGYDKLYALAGQKVGRAWPKEDAQRLTAVYRMFAAPYVALARGQQPLETADAFLLFLTVNGYEDCMTMVSTEIESRVRRIWQEFVVAASNKSTLLDRPSDRRPGLLESVLRPGPQKVRCAFLYNSSPDKSGWTYWHELARTALERGFGGRVETTFRADVSAEDAEQVMDELLHDGWDVIFATSPVFLDACIRQSVDHPKAKILSCSLLASYYHVRSFYLRVYEAKFVLGALAGAMAENDLIGYIADYPICGTPASINAFALGAQMTNPRAKIVLDWSTIPGHDPKQALVEQGVEVFSSRDIGSAGLDSRNFGLYRERDEQITNLGMPVWNWFQLYQDVVKSILSGAWSDDSNQNNDSALSYYMGMNAGAIDIIISERVPAGLQHLCELLKEQITAGTLNPFSEPIIDQNGVERVPRGTIPTPSEIMRMDYLVQNVVGRLPGAEELTEAAQRLVGRQGVKLPEV